MSHEAQPGANKTVSPGFANSLAAITTSVIACSSVVSITLKGIFGATVFKVLAINSLSAPSSTAALIFVLFFLISSAKSCPHCRKPLTTFVLRDN